jgi:hypothetical protein
MKGVLPAILLIALCSACGVAPQPESNRTVAAYEVPLPTVAERHQFLEVLRGEAVAAGFHVDAATEEELRILSEVSPLTMNASIWRGDNDEEIVASAMNPPTEPDRIWITFAKGKNPARFSAFRLRLMRAIARRWPETLSLPIMPTGAIPNPTDMKRTPSGYGVKPSESWRYQEPTAPPAAPSAP